MSRRPNTDPRTDTSTAEHIEHALQIVKSDGIGPALAFMAHAGVAHQVALRVLTAPMYVRSNERRIQLRRNFSPVDVRMTPMILKRSIKR